MAIRLAEVLPNSSPEFWLRMQMNYDLWEARKSARPPARRTVRRAA
jgi:addiction module HigA family antidote